MALFGKKISFDGVKGALSDAKNKISDTVQSIDVKAAVSDASAKVTDSSKKLLSAGKGALEAGKEKAAETYDVLSTGIHNFDYESLAKKEFYQKKFDDYKDLSTEKVATYFRTTFEVDKSTSDMLDEVRGRLPVPASTVDDIFEQCKKEAFRRAIAAFSLGGVMSAIDNHSEAKYSNLSQSYSEFGNQNILTDARGFADMANERYEAKESWTLLDNGYNKGELLDPRNADIEHVIAKKEYYEDQLIRIGTTDDQFIELINSKENLVFADYSLNRSMQDENVREYLTRRGVPDSLNPDIVNVEINGRTVQVNINDVEDTIATAEKTRGQHRSNALKEVGMTVVSTGATMAAQQVVGLIVVETIDIFIDEIKDIAQNGNFLNENGLLQNTIDRKNRIAEKLRVRFEERQIFDRAKALGLEAGVAGALSVIPQILISLIIKMPAFVLSIVRECTLSTVRCVRILSSNDSNKFDSIKIILAGTASAVVGVYIARAITSAIAPVPLLNAFNRQVTDVLTGLLVTAIPLTAIYVFEKNKSKFTFGLLTKKPGTMEQA